MLALDAHRRARLTEEALDVPRVGGSCPAQELQRVELTELQVGDRHDDPHPAHTEHALDAVLAGDELPHTEELLTRVPGRRLLTRRGVIPHWREG